jgi:glutamate formiminotransferase/formiminotetrahydrofolate cyclodeaminase
VMDAFALPKDSAEEKAARSTAIQLANKYAAEIPLRVMETAFKSYQILAAMAEKGNPASISDVGVGLLATRACIDGAWMNVRINLAGLKDEKLKSALLEKVGKISAGSESEFKTVIQIVEGKMS